MTDLPTEIFVRDLTLEMSIGILEEERQKPQKVIVNIAALCRRTREATRTDEITSTVSYVGLIEIVETLARKKHYNLAETFAEDIATEALSIEALDQITVSVEKPDIIDSVETVGVRIVRKRESSAEL